MKKIVLFIVSFFVASSAFADGFSESDYFEPTLICITAGAGAYFGAPKGNEGAYAAGGCLIGAGITYLINSHYKEKYTKAYQHKLDRAHEALKQFEAMMANKAANGDDGPYSLRVREIVPPQRLSNGEVTAPTIREKLIVPGADIRVGD